jgi:hypothetical protein
VGGAAVVQWGGECLHTAETLLLPPRPGEASKLATAEEFLREALAAGPRPQREIEEEAGQADVSRKTLRRARERIAETYKSGMSGPWMWKLKTEDAQGAEDAQQPRLGAFGRDGPSPASNGAQPVEKACVPEDAQGSVGTFAQAPLRAALEDRHLAHASPAATPEGAAEEENGLPADAHEGGAGPREPRAQDRDSDRDGNGDDDAMPGLPAAPDKSAAVAPAGFAANDVALERILLEALGRSRPVLGGIQNALAQAGHDLSKAEVQRLVAKMLAEGKLAQCDSGIPGVPSYCQPSPRCGA